MHRILTTLATLSVCAAAQAATSSATLSVTATEAVSGTAYTITGTATLTGAISASGTFSATVPLTALTGGGTTASTPFTITTSAGTLGGTLTLPVAWLEDSSGTGSATITSAGGSYSGDSGSFPTLAGSESIGISGISLTFSGSGTITTGGTVAAPPPTITAVLDAASNTANLAQGTIFIVKGTNLCPGTTLTAFGIPRPTVSPDGVQITFTPAAGGTGTNALLWYEDPLGGGACQLAGILPSTVAVGNYNVTVTNGTVSAPMAAQVVQRKFAVFTQDSTGTGLTVAQNVVSNTEYDLNRLTTGSINGITISPAHPGEYMVVYGTGLGGVAGDDNAASPVYDFTKNGVTVNVIVGGVSIPALFAGRAGYAGEDQINFQLPSSIAGGCTVSFQVSVNGTLSGTTTIAIAPNTSASACVLPGYTTAQLTAMDNGATINAGSFSLTQLATTEAPYGTVKLDSASGGFTQVTGFQLGALPVTYSSITQGACTVIQVTISNGQTTVSGTATNLDAGKVTLTGPSGASIPSGGVLTETSNSYYLSIGDEGITGVPGLPNGTIVAGKYTLTGAGGSGANSVGSFNVSITLGTPLAITGGLPSTVTRSQNLPVSWVGGNATDPVELIGSSGSTAGTGTSAVTTATEFICTTTAGANSFTIPASVLTQLPATPASAAGGYGSLAVYSGPSPVTFAPSFGSGTIASTFSAMIATGASVTYQ